MSDYGIWLSFNNQEEGFRIPVNPESIEIRENGQGATYDIDKLGEINVIKSPKLTEFAFESIFPATRYPFVVGNILLQPIQYVNYIKKWMGTKRPIRFVFTGASFDINTPASIEEFSWKEVAGSGEDIEYTLRLKKYVFYAAKRVAVVQPQPQQQPVLQQAPPQRPVEQSPPKTYALVPGDSLWKVAQKFLGDGSRWREIQQSNGISDADLRRLPVGMVIKLP